MSRTPKAASSAALSAMKGAKLVKNEATLKAIREKLDEARLLDVDIEAAELELSELREKLTAIRTKELPDLFESAGVDNLGIEPKGNLPGYDAELKPFYSASIPKDPKAAGAALALLRKLKYGDIIKNSFTVDLGKGDEKKATRLEKELKKLKVEFGRKVGVHSSTLTAMIRARHEDGKPFSPKDLETLGAFVGKVVKLEKRK